METGERLAAYLADELDADERDALEAELVRDPELRARLGRLERTDRALRSLPPVEPPAGLADRIHRAVDEELASGSTDAFTARHTAGDEVARQRQRRTLTPLLVAAGAAAVIALIGVVTGSVLRSASDFEPLASDDAAEVSDAQQVPEVAVFATDNDFSELELRRLAVNVDTQFVIHPETRAEEAEPLAERLLGQLLHAEAESEAAPLAEDTDEDTAEQATGDADEADGARVLESPPAAVARCLPELVADSRAVLVPTYVELAAFEGEPAIIYAFVTEEPQSGEFRRVETWAVARDDCQVLGFAQYDR